jgi:hypothetical protein
MGFFEDYLKGNLKYALLLVVLALIPSIVSISFQGNLLIAFLSFALSVLFILANWFVLGWVGYQSAMQKGGGARSGAISGAIINVISGFVSKILAIVIILPASYFFSASTPVSSSAFPQIAALFGFGVSIIMLIVGIVLGFIIDPLFGLVFGALGGAIAQGKNKTVPETKNTLFGGGQ